MPKRQLRKKQRKKEGKNEEKKELQEKIGKGRLFVVGPKLNTRNFGFRSFGELHRNICSKQNFELFVLHWRVVGTFHGGTRADHPDLRFRMLQSIVSKFLLRLDSEFFALEIGKKSVNGFSDRKLRYLFRLVLPQKN